MQIITLILQILCSILCFIASVAVPSYMRKKGENLATKQDISDITRMTEEVQNDFRKQFELYSSDIRFKYNFYFKRYSELYCKLYAVIIQSEYARYFFSKAEKENYPFNDFPFFEIQPIKRNTGTVNENGTMEVLNTDVIETDLSKFNKHYLIKAIIDNSDIASQDLLKLAVSYRLSYEFYSDNEKRIRNETINKIADEEELRLIREMVCCIVREYNSLRKDLKMSFDETELKTGEPNISTQSQIQ